MNDARMVQRRVLKCFRNGKPKEFVDALVREFALTVYLNEQEIATLLCTPEYLEDLAVGFLFSEGLMAHKDGPKAVIMQVTQKEIQVKNASLTAPVEKAIGKRYLAAGGGKGIDFSRLLTLRTGAPLGTGLRIAPAQVLNGMKELQARSELFQTTGGVHSALLASKARVILYREDIGRHNAVDKIIGHGLRQGLAPDTLILFTSGRLSFEMLLKVAKFGIPILVSRSAPTNLAVELAEELGVTLVGFTRGESFNVYTHPERVSHQNGV